MRLIDADDLRQVLEVFSEKDSLGHTPVQLCDAMPTIDAVEVKHGKWVHEFGGYVNCSECGASPLLDGEREYVETNYCPNCGAKMDGEKKHE